MPWGSVGDHHTYVGFRCSKKAEKHCNMPYGAHAGRPIKRGEKEWVSYPRHRDVWGPAVTQKYKRHQNVPFKKKLKNFLPREACKNVSPGPNGQKMLHGCPTSSVVWGVLFVGTFVQLNIQCLNCSGVEDLNPTQQFFFQPPQHVAKLCTGGEGVSYMLYTCTQLRT